MNKRFFVAALSLLVLASISVRTTSAQSCQNKATFGVHTTLPVDKTLQSQIEVTYFTTDDPNAFISEKAGIGRSASYVHLDSDRFVAKLEGLTKEGLASIKKQQSATSYLGEMAELNLENNSVNAEAKMMKASLTSPNRNDITGLDRKTEISVNKGSARDGAYYRVGLLSWFVNGTPNAGQGIVDYDANVLLKPGETAVFKLMGDGEVKRSGAARSYIAVTMRSVSNAALASLAR